MERAALCDLPERLGPDAPTVLVPWTTRDIAVHLYLREHDPVARPGLVLPGPGRGCTPVITTRARGQDFWQIVAAVRSGPRGVFRVGWLRPVPDLNEMFVHHEDRSTGPPQSRTPARSCPRELSADSHVGALGPSDRHPPQSPVSIGIIRSRRRRRRASMWPPPWTDPARHVRLHGRSDPVLVRQRPAASGRSAVGNAAESHRGHLLVGCLPHPAPWHAAPRGVTTWTKRTSKWCVTATTTPRTSRYEWLRGLTARSCLRRGSTTAGLHLDCIWTTSPMVTDLTMAARVDLLDWLRQQCAAFVSQPARV